MHFAEPISVVIAGVLRASMVYSLVLVAPLSHPRGREKGTGVVFGLIAIIWVVFLAFLDDQWAVECAILLVAPQSFLSTARRRRVALD